MKCFNYILDLPDSFFKIIIAILISLILILGFFLNNIFIAVVDGSSMEDTIHHGDVLIINKKSYSTTSPKRYDIVNKYYYPEGKPEPAFICQYLVDKESWKVKEVKEGIKKELN